MHLVEVRCSRDVSRHLRNDVSDSPAAASLPGFDTRHATRDTRHATRDTRHATRDTRHTTHDTRHTARSTQHAAHTAKLEEVRFCRPLTARLLIDGRLFTNSQRIICHNLATVNDTTNTSSFGHHDHRTSTDKSYRRNDGEKCASHVVGNDVCLPRRVGAESRHKGPFLRPRLQKPFRASQTRSKPALKSVFLRTASTHCLSTVSSEVRQRRSHLTSPTGRFVSCLQGQMTDGLLDQALMSIVIVIVTVIVLTSPNAPMGLQPKRRGLNSHLNNFFLTSQLQRRIYNRNYTCTKFCMLNSRLTP